MYIIKIVFDYLVAIVYYLKETITNAFEDEFLKSVKYPLNKSVAKYLILQSPKHRKEWRMESLGACALLTVLYSWLLF